MKETTHLSCAIDAARNSKAAYDTYVKELLADKQILARILKYAVDEFSDMEICDILPCIGDDIEVAQTVLDAGLSNLGKEQGSRTEDSVPGEGMVTYDIRFSAYRKGRQMKFLLNVEAQKSSDYVKLGYHLENRIVFYMARMISAQKQTEFFHSDYDRIKPVRSVWICMDNKEGEDSIEEIALTRTVKYGKPKNYDISNLAKGIIVNIRLNKENDAGTQKKSENELIAMLEVLLSNKKEDEKKQRLVNDHGMVMTQEFERRLDHMCNVSDLQWEMAEQSGIEKGVERGRIEGMISAYLDDGADEEFITDKLMKKYSLTREEAKRYLEQLTLQEA